MRRFLSVFFILLFHGARAGVFPVYAGTDAIARAILKSKPGDTLIIHSGTYYESNLSITHPLTLIGKDWPVIDGQHKAQILSISANHTTVKGIRFINCGKSNSDDFAAIKLYSVKRVTIQDNEFDNNFFAIYLLNSDSCIIHSNDIKGYAVNEQSSGNGIHLWKCRNNIISNNTVSGHRDGIYFEFVSDSRIENNKSFSNVRYGLHFMFSDRNGYSHNRFYHNGAGVAVMYSKNIHMTGNTFDLNRGSAAYGLLLKDITDSRIFNNRFEYNSIGIYMEGSNRLIITANNFLNNGWAIRILSNCEQNEILRNNFTGNSFDVSTNGPASSNTFNNNYWDKYEGYDLNRDAIGDIPYRPVSLYAMLMERIPIALILYRSLIVTIFERIEKIAPVITPVELSDNEPRMKPWKLSLK
jgi:nitrous oxidase accessory protein